MRAMKRAIKAASKHNTAADVDGEIVGDGGLMGRLKSELTSGPTWGGDPNIKLHGSLPNADAMSVVSTLISFRNNGGVVV